MFEQLEKINHRPRPFEFYTAQELWTDEYTSKQMLSYHLNEDVDLSSRKGEFINRSVEWITSHFDIRPGTRVADFGCGPGLYTTRLARKQAVVTGIDFSKNSIDYAEKAAAAEGLPIQYVNQNYLEFGTDDRYDLIIMIMCDFCALSPDRRKIMLNKYHSLLKPGGSVLLDLYSLKAFDERKETAQYELNSLNSFWSPNKYHGFLNTFKYEKEKVVLDKYTLIEADRTRTVYNWLQYFSTDAVKQEFAECGLIIQELFSDVAGSSFSTEAAEMAVVAKSK
jgi:2-polyprenyl-3-methyl-5-hydroxy-6-metoxy-1,4-benzoquinol methylase